MTGGDTSAPTYSPKSSVMRTSIHVGPLTMSKSNTQNAPLTPQDLQDIRKKAQAGHIEPEHLVTDAVAEKIKDYARLKDELYDLNSRVVTNPYIQSQMGPMNLLNRLPWKMQPDIATKVNGTTEASGSDMQRFLEKTDRVFHQYYRQPVFGLSSSRSPAMSGAIRTHFPAITDHPDAFMGTSRDIYEETLKSHNALLEIEQKAGKQLSDKPFDIPKELAKWDKNIQIKNPGIAVGKILKNLDQGSDTGGVSTTSQNMEDIFK